MATNKMFYRRGFHIYGVVNLCSVNLLMKAVVLEDVVLHLVQLGLSYISVNVRKSHLRKFYLVGLPDSLPNNLVQVVLHHVVLHQGSRRG